MPKAHHCPILIVDDEPDDVALIRLLLRKAEVPNPVLTFTDSGEALAFLREVTASPEAAVLTPCVMLLDIKMPKVHGFVLLKWARRQSTLDRMRILMLSGSDEPKDHLRAEKLGADGYLVKFPSADVLAELIGAARAAVPAL
jgi:CheY-like chemotaxis protein